MQTYAKILNELFYTLVFILSVWIWCVADTYSPSSFR